jgi:polar amino acid transport system substrate-binding protein
MFQLIAILDFIFKIQDFLESQAMFVALLFLLFSQSGSTSFYDGSGCTDVNLRLNLPCSVKSRTITVVTNTDSAPFVSRIGNGVPFGFDIDLMNYIGYIYRINFEYRYALFQDFIPEVQNKTNTISISSQTVTEERMKSVDFAQFFKTGSSFLVQSTYSRTISGLASLCGMIVVVQTGTIQERDVQKQNTQCGVNQITIISVITYTEVVRLIDNGTATVAVYDEALLVTTALQSNGQLKVVGDPYDVQPYGIVCNKKSKVLCCSLVNAINYLINEGIYKELLMKYSFSYRNNGICPSRINLIGVTCESKCQPSKSTCNSNLN